jgi:RHS repeat-associated protein
VATENKSLRSGRHPWTPAGEALPTGLGAPKPKTRALYDGLLLVRERNNANTPTVTYTRGRDLSGSLAGAGGIGGLLARSHGYSGGNWSSHTAYHADGNGNVTALANSSGTLQASYRYDPYGRYLAGGGTLASANVMRFSSKPWVGFAGAATSGLCYYGYRFYDPYLQRWVNRDPIHELGSRHIYGFCSNSPFSRYDLYGLSDWDWSWWDVCLPPVGYFHLFYDLGDSVREGFVSMVTGFHTALPGGKRRAEEFEDACSTEAGASCTTSPAVCETIKELRGDILDIVTGVPGTIVTGPAVPTDALDLHATAVHCQILIQATKNSTNSNKGH